MMRKNKILIKYNSGLSLIEILIAIAIFAVLGVLISSSLILTIQGSKKSESMVRVRENLNYSLNVIERNLRNANSIKEPIANNCGTTFINYWDQNTNSASFSCLNMGTDNAYIASGTGNIRLTSDTVKITSCSFTCNASDPPLVTVSITAKDRYVTGALGAEVSAENKIYLRSK